MKRLTAVNKIKDVLSRVAPDAEIILFGSEARGDARPDSDFDLLILTEKDTLTYEDKDAITRPLFMLEYSDGIEVNALVFSKKEWHNRPFKTPFEINIINEGIRL